MPKNLLIVESPAKAKTIEKILGKNFEVKSCYGHIRDLEKAGMGIDIEKNYKPSYIVPAEKQKVVNDLKKIAKKSDEVWLATDEDREGEAISWHLCEVLGLDPKTTKRIVFHEITKPAIQNAVQNPRTVDMNLVNAQQARRVLDRIVGFELSPVLWRKISMRNNLSAGRVQSVAVRLIAEREREINAFEVQSSFKVEAWFTAKDSNDKNISFKAEGAKYSAAEDAENFLKTCIGAKYKVSDIQIKPAKRSPAPPFTTSTLQQEASRKLGYGVSRTMLLAQRLYENGHISYMRTDSVNLSNTALGDITRTVKGMFGEEYHQFRKYKTKNESAQEAHEAIRPTYMNHPTINDADAKKLYELIWKRTMASQMSDAELGIGRPSTYAPTISTILKRGYVEKRDKEGVKRDYRIFILEKDQIKKIVAHENTGAEKSKLFPTDLGLVVTDFLKQYFDDIMDYGFTARIEEEFDEVAEGKMKWNKMIDDFYNPFKKDVEKTIETAERVKGERELGTDPISGKPIVARMGRFGPMVQIGIADENDKPHFAALKKGQSIETITLAEALDLFKLPLTLGEYEGKEVYVNMGRFGPYVKWGEDFISLPRGEDPLEVDMERAVELINQKKEADAPIAMFEGKPVTRGKGRFGPYIKWNDMFINVPRRYDFDALSQKDINELVEAKIKKEANRYLQTWPEEKISIENARWGPVLKFGKKILRIPKKADDVKYTAEELSSISLDDVK